MVLKELIFNSFYIWEDVVLLKELILTDFTLERCGCLDSTNFQQFLIWEDMVVLKEVIFNSFYFRQVWWS